MIRTYTLRIFGSAFIAVAFLVVTSCQFTPDNPDPKSSAGAMTTFSNDAQLLDYLKKAFITTALPQEAFMLGMPTVRFDAGEIDVALAEAPTASAGTNAFSGTNIQEVDVDEADKVKTDGNYIYISSGDSIQVVDVRQPQTTTKINRIAVDGTVDDLYLYNNHLIILYRQQTWWGEPWLVEAPGDMLIGIAREVPINSKFGVRMLDVTDPVAPKLVKETIIDGRLVSSRLTGGKLHLVSQFLPQLPPLVLYYDGTDAGKEQAEATNTALINGLTLDSLLPSFTSVDNSGQTTKASRLVEANNFFYPDVPDGGGIVTITSFHLDLPEIPMTTAGIVANAHTVYASTQALYIAAAHWNAVTPLLDGTIDQSPEYLYSTVIHKFDISGNEVTSVGSGIVPGNIINQFSLGEHNGALRVATTTNPTMTRLPSSNVYVLSATSSGLEIIGRVEGLAPGESLYAARFLGDRGFLVTFVKVDPLFTLDLSDPRNPFVAGELKVPGFSEYIHPLGSNHLITIGKDTAEQDGITWHQGLQLSIFDVSDFANPKLLHLEKMGTRGSYSEALYNHKAFTFWAERGLLAIPVSLTEHLTPPLDVRQYGTTTFQGLYVYRVDAINGFSFLGRVDAANLQWTRGIFIEDNVFTVQPNQLISNPITDFKTLQRLTLL